MDLKPHFYTVFKTLNPYNYQELSEHKFLTLLKYYFFVIFFSVMVMFLLLVPYFYYTGNHISDGAAHFDNLTIKSDFQLKESFNILSDPVIRFDSLNTNLTDEFVLITPDMVSYRHYLIFGDTRQIPLSSGVDVASSERARTLISLGILFLLPALFFWAVVFSLVYFTVIIFLTYVLILILAGIFNIDSTLLKLLKLCVFASTPFIFLQLILMPFFRIFLLPLAAYWILVFIVVFLWHDTQSKNVSHGGDTGAYGHSGKKNIFGGNDDSGYKSKTKIGSRDEYDVDSNGNLKSSAKRHKSVDEENDGYVELK